MDILTLFVVIPFLTITGILFIKDTRHVKIVSAIGMGIQLIMAGSACISLPFSQAYGKYG